MTSLGTGRPSDPDVGAHYENVERARSIAGLYDLRSPAGERYRYRMERVLAHLEGLEGQLLDAGCGTGQMIRFLHERSRGRFVVTGLDRSAAMLEVAQEVTSAVPNVRLEAGRIEQLPFPTATFDVVLVMGSLEYVGDVPGALREVARVTRPRGHVVVTMMNARSPYRLWDGLVGARLRRRRGTVESPIRQILGERALSATLRIVGLSPVATEYFDFNLLLSPLDARFPRTGMLIERCLRPLARTPLRRLANDFLVSTVRTHDASRGGIEPSKSLHS